MSELSAELRCNLWLQGFGEEELREEELVEIQAFQQPGGRRERNWSWDGPGMGRWVLRDTVRKFTLGLKVVGGERCTTDQFRCFCKC